MRWRKPSFHNHEWKQALYRYLYTLVLLLFVASSGGAQPLPPGTYPGYLIIKPDGSQDIYVQSAVSVSTWQVDVVIVGSTLASVTGAGRYTHGSTVTLVPVPGQGTAFTGWGGDPECSSTPFPITKNLKCIANFGTTPAITLTIVHAGTGGGTSTPSPGVTTRTAGEVITLTATASSGSIKAGVTPAPCAEPSFIMPSASITCTITFNTAPVSFNVAITNAGTGSGTTTGSGSYLPGILVHLTYAPAAGSVFAGWTGDPICASDFTMPSTNVNCVANWTLSPPSTGLGRWVKLNTGSSSDPQPVSGGFQPWAYHNGTGDLWFYSSSQAGKVYRFNHGTMRWTVTSNGLVGSAIHNCGLVLAAVNDEMYMGGCAPDGGQGGSWVISTSPASLGVMAYRSTEVFGRSTDPLCIYDRNAGVIQCVGGWSNTTTLVEKDVTPFAGLSGWTLKNPTGSIPPLGVSEASGSNVDEFTRTTYNRGGWSPALGKLWVTDKQQDFYTYDRNTNVWTKKVMTGTKPPSAANVAYHDIAGILVAVKSCVIGAAGTCDGEAQTYLGNITTGVWSLGPGPTQGPSKNQYWASNILYNEARQTIQFISHASGLPSLWEFTPSTTPPDPPTTNYTFTVTKTGSGNATLGGGGTYLSGTVVTATATPDANSQMDGWVEPTCPTFAIAANSTCTAKINPKTVVPIGPYPDVPNLPADVFVPIECGPKTAQGAAIFDMSPWPCGGGSKHQRWAADWFGNVWTGFGDTSPSSHAGNPSQGQGYRLRLSDGLWTRWNPACRPAGEIQPSYPDEVPWAWDKRGYFWLLGGVTQGTDGATCNSGGGESGSTLYKTGLFKYTVATDRWERFPSVGGTNALWGIFDNVNKNLMYAGGGGTGACGSALFKVNVDTLVRTSFNLCLSAVPFPGDPYGTFEDYADVRVASTYAFDEVGRILYIVGYHNKKVASETSGQPVLRLWAINVDTSVITRRADPPNATFNEYRNPDAQDIVWDTVNRRVLFPYNRTHCGVVQAMYSYNPTTNVWTTHSITPSSTVPGGPVRGNTAVYDPFHNVMIVGGTVACSDWGFPGLPNMTHWFMWRHPGTP